MPEPAYPYAFQGNGLRRFSSIVAMSTWVNGAGTVKLLIFHSDGMVSVLLVDARCGADVGARVFRKQGMDEDKPQGPGCGCPKTIDRYVSFDGIDCDGKARRLMEVIERRMADSGAEHPFLKYFMAKRQPRSGPAPDELFLIHSNINQIREFFEQCGDQESLALLMQLEEECC